MQARRLSVALAAALVSSLVAGPALAQTPGPADSGRGSAYGARLDTALGELLGPQPSVEAVFPPDDSDEDVLLEVPADPVLNSGTLSVESQADADPAVEATLQEVVADQSTASLPDGWNARGYAVAEALTALEETLTADVVEGEALTSCVDGQPVHATGANLVNATLGGGDLLGTGELLEGIELTADEPNNVVFDQAGVRIVTWETNWDGATGTTDGSQTVFVNALHVTVDLELLDLELLPEDLQGVVDQLLGDGGTDDLLDGGDTGDVLDGGDQLGGVETQDEQVEDAQVERLQAEQAQQPETSTAEPLQQSQDVQVQQEGETIDLIVSHAESEATCGPVDGDDLGITKDVSSDVVAPGDTFSYTITVPNDRACTLETLDVVDVIEGPAGSEVVATSPEADEVDGMSVTWNDLGPVEPGEELVLGIDVRVPTDAADGSVYRETVTASGECDGEPVDGGLEFDGPTVRADEPPPPPPPPDNPLPRTGGGTTTSLGGLALLAAGAGLARVTRRA